MPEDIVKAVFYASDRYRASIFSCAPDETQAVRQNEQAKEFCKECGFELGIYNPHKCCNVTCDLWDVLQND